MKQLLIVEDDSSLNSGLCRALRSPELSVTSCRSLREAEEQLLCGDVALLLLDINLPDGSGLSLLRALRARGSAFPVILLTASDTDEEIVEGLALGADDYVTKPFSLKVLRARIDAQLRRQTDRDNNITYVIRDYSFDFERMLFYRNGERIDLSKTEQRLLRLLIEQRGRPLGRTYLIDRIWGNEAVYLDANALSVAVSRLRTKLSAQTYIKTVYGVGYLWED